MIKEVKTRNKVWCIPMHQPMQAYILNEEAKKKMFTVKLMKGSKIFLYYAERVAIDRSDIEERSIWFKWVETGEDGASLIYEDSFMIDGEDFDFCVVEQAGKTVEVIRSLSHEKNKKTA